MERSPAIALVRIEEAARRVGLSRSKLYEYVASGELPTVRFGRARRVQLTDLDAFVARHRDGAQADGGGADA